VNFLGHSWWRFLLFFPGQRYRQGFSSFLSAFSNSSGLKALGGQNKVRCLRKSGFFYSNFLLTPLSRSRYAGSVFTPPPMDANLRNLLDSPKLLFGMFA
jgi:hypothetical protein